ncbi:ATP-NAD kinase-like domain-containing protein [Irpex lacteus]|nr:ATP-NAD kinase-like domain-containing protein [Irpex lacteus]
MSTLKRVLAPAGQKDKGKQDLPANATKLKELTIGDKHGKTSEFVLTEDTLYVTRPSDQQWPRIAAPLRHIVWAELTGDDLKLSLLARKKSDKLYLVHIQGAVPADKKEDAQQFAEAVMEASHKGVKRGRHLLVLVNPKSGPKIAPLFKAAHCTTDVTFTTHYRHAIEIVKSIPLDKYDAIVTVSGDGLVHEVLNGLAAHENPMQALKIPIAPIPTGSGNALALNLLGLQEGFDVSAAALNAAKGLPCRRHLSMTQGDKRILSFVSQRWGSWLSSMLIPSTYVHGRRVSIKVVEADKQKMFDNFHATRSEPAGGSSLPPLLYKDEPTGEGWITFDNRFVLYAGKGPYVARDLMQFPVSHPNDGCIDVVIQEVVPRKEMISMIDGADEGRAFWAEKQRYFKAEAYRVETHAPNSSLSIDGERYPFEPTRSKYILNLRRGFRPTVHTTPSSTILL